MYVPPHFQEIRSDAIGALIEDAPLACIVAIGAINGPRTSGDGRMADGMAKRLAEGE